MLAEEMYCNGSLIRSSYTVGSKELKLIVDKIYAIWPEEFMSRSLEKQILGMTKTGHRVDEPSAQFYTWRPLSRGLAKLYGITDLAGLKAKQWYGKRYCFNSKKIQLKVHYDLEVAHPELPIHAYDIYYASTYEKDLGEVTQYRDVYFCASKSDVDTWCSARNLALPENTLTQPSMYGLIFDKDTLEAVKLKAYKLT